MIKKKTVAYLSDLMNVGKATLQDLYLLNIQSIEQLALADPDDLYTKLEEIHKNITIRVCGMFLRL
jgi:nucleotidyltransferase/DNA polymerase involved in DNA repair